MKSAGELKLRDIMYKDFSEALKHIRRSVTSSSVEIYEKWNEEYGDLSH